MFTTIHSHEELGHNCSAAAHFQFQQSRSNHLVRKELQQHLYQHQQQLHGYIDYVQRHSHQLLTLIVDDPTQDPHSAESQVSAKEFDRLALLLRPADPQQSDPGSPMEISPSPFTGTYILRSLQNTIVGTRNSAGIATGINKKECLTSCLLSKIKPTLTPDSIGTMFTAVTLHSPLAAIVF